MQPFLEHLHQLMQKICPFCKKKTCFFYFAHLFLQNSHISFSIIHNYSIKYLFFPLSSLSQTQHNPHSHHHPTTQPPSSSTTIPFNQATINEIHIHVQPSHHQPASKIPNPKIHHQPTQSPSSTYNMIHPTKSSKSNHFQID